MRFGEIFLVIDEDARARVEICEILVRSGYQAEVIQRCAEFRSAICPSAYACILVGVEPPEPPELAELETLTWARNNSAAALVAMSSSTAVEVRIAAFRSGADLFIPKPVDERELLAALGGILLRRQRLAGACCAPPLPAQPQPASDEVWVLDCSAWRLRSPQGVGIPLTSHEFVLLRALILAKGEAVPRRTLLQLLYRRDDSSASRALDAVVLRLRRKAALQCKNELPLRTKHGCGYLFLGGVLMPSGGFVGAD